jgi:hypothetical protein
VLAAAQLIENSASNTDQDLLLRFRIKHAAAASPLECRSFHSAQKIAETTKVLDPHSRDLLRDHAANVVLKRVVGHCVSYRGLQVGQADCFLAILATCSFGPVFRFHSHAFFDILHPALDDVHHSVAHVHKRCRRNDIHDDLFIPIEKRA